MAELLTQPELATVPPVETLGPHDAGLPMAREEFARRDYEPGYRYELIHGVLIVTPAPALEHRDANEQLGYWLRHYRDHHPQGKALDLTVPEQDVRTPTCMRRCDRAIWAGLGRLPHPEDDVPTIVVEFVSARSWDRRRDYVEKREEYLAAGARECWILDRFARRLVALTRNEGTWDESVIAADDVFRPALLPGFEFSVSELLAIGDRHVG